MILLAVDSSGREGSLALARGEGSNLETIEVVNLDGGNFSAQLVPRIASLLTQHKFTRRDLGGFAVAVGPGSFTGLRVGIAAVSRLEAVARAGGKQGNVIAALDAGRRQAFVGEYKLSGETASNIKEHLVLWEELGMLAAGRPVVTPDKNVAEGLRQSGATVVEILNLRADAIARIGWKKLAAGDVADVATLEANYIRRTDAEILVHGK